MSDINYNYATDIVFQYASILEDVNTAIKYLEEEQWKRGIGLVAAEADTSEKDYHKEMTDWLSEMAVKKDQRANNDG